VEIVQLILGFEAGFGEINEIINEIKEKSATEENLGLLPNI
jgi:hypothetical protein